MNLPEFLHADSDAKIFGYAASPARTYVCVSGGKKCSFFGKFGVLCFLETPVLRFALLPYYRRIVEEYAR